MASGVMPRSQRTATFIFRWPAVLSPRVRCLEPYGAYRSEDGVCERALFVIDKNGVIAWSYCSPIAVNPGAEGILQALENLSKSENPMSKLSVPVGVDDHMQGDPAAACVLVEYGDYQCPSCGQAYTIVKRLQRHFGKRLAFVFRNFPLTQTSSLGGTGR